MTPSLRTIDLPGRVRLQYAEQGEPSGMPVIALHGVTDSWRSFEPVLRHLPPDLHVYALTQRGHGDSGKPEGGYCPADFAADVAAFMDARQIHQAVIVGHSMGSVNAMRFALDHPSRVRALVLAGTMPFFGAHADLAAFHREQISALVDPVSPDYAREFQLGTIAQPVPAALVDTMVAESLKAPARVWRRSFDGFMGDDFSARLPQIDMPALIVWGRHDAFCHEAAQHALLAALPSARLIEYADAGHAMHWEEPRRFARDLAEFVATTAAPAAVA